MTMAGKRKQHPATSDTDQAGAATRKLEKKLDAARATESKRLRRLAKAQTTQARIVAKRQQEAADAAAEVSRLASKLAAANHAAAEADGAVPGDTPGDGGDGGDGEEALGAAVDPGSRATDLVSVQLGLVGHSRHEAQDGHEASDGDAFGDQAAGDQARRDQAGHGQGHGDDPKADGGSVNGK
jgi:hypothetical protein